ncbi:MAG: choice-of-anchor X domain-containing protein, partial [Planctomycetota bacterium]
MVLLLLANPLQVRAQSIEAKQVAAPATDITSGIVRLPDPASTPTSSAAAILPLSFAPMRGGGFAAELRYPVEKQGTLVLALLSPNAASLRVLAAPAGAPLAPIDQAWRAQRTTGFAGDSMPGWIVDRRELHDVPVGMWQLRIESSTASEGWLFASASSELRAEAWITTQRLVAGQPIGIAARASGSDLRHVERARAVLECAGEVLELAMLDDGSHSDGAADDGVFGALIPEDLLGTVRVRIELAGTTPAAATFLRSSQLEFPVLAPCALLDGTVTAHLVDESHLQIDIGAIATGSERRLHVSAEVWGRDERGEQVPVCWLSKMLSPQVSGITWQLPLVLDLDWLEYAAALAPLELRAVRVQDPDTEVVFDALDRIELATQPLPMQRRAGAA